MWNKIFFKESVLLQYRLKWTREGDINIIYFHKVMKGGVIKLFENYWWGNRFYEGG